MTPEGLPHRRRGYVAVVALLLLATGATGAVFLRPALNDPDGLDFPSTSPEYFDESAFIVVFPEEPEYIDEVRNDDQYMLEDPDDVDGPAWGAVDAARLGEFNPYSDIDAVIDW